MQRSKCSEMRSGTSRKPCCNSVAFCLQSSALVLRALVLGGHYFRTRATPGRICSSWWIESSSNVLQLWSPSCQTLSRSVTVVEIVCSLCSSRKCMHGNLFGDHAPRIAPLERVFPNATFPFVRRVSPHVWLSAATAKTCARTPERCVCV